MGGAPLQHVQSTISPLLVQPPAGFPISSQHVVDDGNLQPEVTSWHWMIEELRIVSIMLQEEHQRLVRADLVSLESSLVMGTKLAARARRMKDGSLIKYMSVWPKQALDRVRKVMKPGDVMSEIIQAMPPISDPSEESRGLGYSEESEGDGASYQQLDREYIEEGRILHMNKKWYPDKPLGVNLRPRKGSSSVQK